MISAVLDTNILASGTVIAATVPGQILNAWRDGQFELVLSTYILDELERTLKKPYFQNRLKPRLTAAYFELLQNEATIIPISANIQNIATHPEDDLILAAAVSAKTNYLVTGDGPLLRKVGPTFQGVTLVTPHEFLQVLKRIS